MNKTHVVLSTVVMLLIVSNLIYLFWPVQKAVPLIIPKNLPSYTETDLAKYNGDDPDLPIYIAYEGYVYDVSEGRDYYTPGHVYHWLVGRDATDELHVAGGKIVQEKYPIVGKFISE